MQMTNQRSLSETVCFEGIALHSGKFSKIKILPAKANQGVLFKRVDLSKNNLVQASYLNVSSAKLCTTLENNFGVKVSTVEHLLAALYLAEIDNAIIEINTDEVDNGWISLKLFKNSEKSRKKSFTRKRKFLKILNKVELIDNKKRISIEPSDETLEVEFQLDYQNEIIGKQKNTINFERDDLEDVSTSRTFCLYKDIEKIKQAGLAKGGSLENAVVVDEDRVLNEGGLRNEKEFVNHKILDLVGDFLLSGYRILGKVKCYQGGHELTNMFLRKMLDSKLSTFNKKIGNSKISKKFNRTPSINLAVNA